MPKFKQTLTLASLALALTGLAIAAPPSGFQVKPYVFDQETTLSVDVQSAWVAHQGLPDSGNSNHALYLQKFGPTAANAAAAATVDGVAGIKLTELGFDYRNDGHCGAGAPRFNVVTADNVLHFCGCAGAAVHLVDVPAVGWTRVRFNGADCYPPIPPGSVVKSIDIVFDEGTDQGQGFVYMDNIDINGTLIGKPGNAK